GPGEHPVRLDRWSAETGAPVERLWPSGGVDACRPGRIRDGSKHRAPQHQRRQIMDPSPGGRNLVAVTPTPGRTSAKALQVDQPDST
ncbi:MAG TPA: hypothetical protein VIK11_12605, partial [Tepidiformaceae bacterium]